LNSDNEAREIGGLIAALDFFNTKIGYLITADTRDTLLHSGKRIELIPAHSMDFQDISTG
jgi:putative ubiquitin-RnfH superfamily antitoxin RatB of RatAB toxin-antitoxin module